MLDANLKAQLQGLPREAARSPIELVASLDDSAKSARAARRCSSEIAALSDKITRASSADDDDAHARRSRSTAPAPTSACASPASRWATSSPRWCSRCCRSAATRPRSTHERASSRSSDLDGDFDFETYFSLSCQNCPDVVQALNLMACSTRTSRHVAIDGALFQDEVEARQVMAVPTVFLNGEPFGQGRMSLEEIVAKLDTGAAERDGRRRSTPRTPFDVLVVGGGPAGAAAAIYAARKGIRTGVAAERFGGQVLDTHGHRELHLGAGHRRPEARRRARAARAGTTTSTS